MFILIFKFIQIFNQNLIFNFRRIIKTSLTYSTMILISIILTLINFYLLLILSSISLRMKRMLTIELILYPTMFMLIIHFHSIQFNTIFTIFLMTGFLLCLIVSIFGIGFKSNYLYCTFYFISDY